MTTIQKRVVRSDLWIDRAFDEGLKGEPDISLNVFPVEGDPAACRAYQGRSRAEHGQPLLLHGMRNPATDSTKPGAQQPCPPNRANSKSSTEQRQPEDAGARVQAADHDLERSGRRRVAWRSEITDREPQAFSRGASARPWARTSAEFQDALLGRDRKSTRLNSSHALLSRMPSSA